MLFIYDEDRVECIRLNVDIKQQRKRLFSKYASNLAFFNIQILKKLFYCHRIFVNVESLHNCLYSFSFQFHLNKSVSKFNNKKF